MRCDIFSHLAIRNVGIIWSEYFVIHKNLNETFISPFWYYSYNVIDQIVHNGPGM